MLDERCEPPAASNQSPPVPALGAGTGAFAINGVGSHMLSTARAVFSISLLALPAVLFAQAGSSEPQIIAAADTAKINVGTRKLAGQMVATVRVGEDGRVGEVLVTQNTAESVFEPQLVKVLQSARFRPARRRSGSRTAR